LEDLDERRPLVLGGGAQHRRRARLVATNVASAPIASDSGLNGKSSEPIGVDFVTLPSSLVGEYWPFVSP